MWAVGCIFAELLTLKPLFQGAEVKATPNPFQVRGSPSSFRCECHDDDELHLLSLVISCFILLFSDLCVIWVKFFTAGST